MADNSELEVLLACFDGHKRAGKSRRELDRRIKDSGGTILDETVVRVTDKGAMHVVDPRRVVGGTITPAITWAVFCVLAGLGWSGTLFWALIGALCGGLYAYYTEHLLTKNQLKRLGTRLPPDVSALLLYAHGIDAKALLDDVATEDPRLASVATIDADLSATIISGARAPIDSPSTATGSPEPNRTSLVSMLAFRYAGAETAARVNARAVAALKETREQPPVQTELLLRADKSGRHHVMSPGTGVRAFAPTDAIGWGLFGVVYGAIIGVQGDGGVLVSTEDAVVKGILWAIFGLVAGTLYGVFAGRSTSARRIKPLRPLLLPDTSIALCWAEGPVSDDSIADWSASASDQLRLGFSPAPGGALLEV